MLSVWKWLSWVRHFWSKQWKSFRIWRFGNCTKDLSYQPSTRISRREQRSLVSYEHDWLFTGEALSKPGRCRGTEYVEEGSEGQTGGGRVFREVFVWGAQGTRREPRAPCQEASRRPPLPLQCKQIKNPQGVHRRHVGVVWTMLRLRGVRTCACDVILA